MHDGGGARPGSVRVLVVEGSEHLRERVEALVAELPGARLAGVTGDAEGAVGWLARGRADAVLVDVDLGVWPELDAIARVRAAASGAVLVVIGEALDPETEARCRALGADFCFRTSAAFERISEVLLHLVTARNPAAAT